MPETKNQNSPWKLENFCPITKMSIEGTVAVASLAAAITTIFVATGAIAGPAFLASVANPVGIAALFVAAVYFAVAAYTSYKQLYKNEEISGAVTKAEGVEKEAGRAEAAARQAETAKTGAEAAQKAVEEKAESFATKDELKAAQNELNKTLASDDFAKSVVGKASVISVLEGKFKTK